jgi:hypothetical protein
MHAPASRFTYLFLIIILLTILKTTTHVVCNQLFSQTPRVSQISFDHSSPPELPPTGSSIDHAPKQETKPAGPAAKKVRVFEYQQHPLQVPFYAVPYDTAKSEPKNTTTTTTTQKPAAIEPVVVRQRFTTPPTQDLWPYTVAFRTSEPSYDDLAVAVTDLKGAESSTSLQPQKLTTTPATVTYSEVTNPPSPDNGQSPQFTSTTSEGPSEFITVSGQQKTRPIIISTTTPQPELLPSTKVQSATTQLPIKSSTSSVISSSVNQSQTPALLLYSIRYEIRSFDLNASITSKQYSDHSESNSALIDQHRLKTPTSKPLIAGLKNAICLDFYYSPSESFIFWIDVIEEKIFRGTMSNGIITNVNMIIQGGLSSAEGLAVDWVGKNIYWVESTLDHIEVANINGSSRKTLIAGDMESPRAISVDPRYGLLFWTDWDKKNPRIERATMSGDDRKTIVDIKEVNGGWPNGLTLDYDALKIYWIDANSDSIHVVDYEGNNPKALLRKIKSLGHPFAITLYDNNLYWTDWKTNFISAANKYDGSEPKAHIQRHQTRLFDIKVYHPSRQPKVADNLNPCAFNNGNCSHLCLLSVNSSRICACPHLMKLTKDNMTCESYEKVLLIGKSNEIRAVDITKPLHHIMAPITVPKVFGPRQFEFDAKSRSIFWADSATNEVKRAQLAGSSIETIIDVIIETPNGLALDWISGNIYVTSTSSITKTGKIFISNLKGEYISILMDHQQGIISPKSIAVHPLRGLLFCIDENELGEPLIFMASMNGQNKTIIVAKHFDQTLINPVSLAIDFEKDRVYWVNQASLVTDNSTIQYYDIAENRIITLYNEAELLPEQQIHPGVLCVDGDHLVISSRAPSDNIIRASKDNITDRFVYKTQTLDHIMALKVYNASAQVGTNACASNNGGCSQLCIPINESNRTCKCTMGYFINPSNETECLGRDLFLIYSSNQGMKGISLEPNASSEDYYLPPIHRAFRASSIDYIYRDNLIYWVDNEEGSITRINRDTTNHHVIIQGLEAEEYIGIDWIAGNIYWLDPYYDVIEVARLNGTNRYVIVSGDIDKANGIVVNPLRGYIVWSDVGSIPKIERARLDGSDRKVIVSTKLSHIDELAIDYLEDTIYWIDSTNSIIERVNSDGSSRKVIYNGLLNSKGSQEHFIAMAVYQQYLYVADASYEGSIIRFDKKNTNESKVIQHNLGDNIKDITVFAPQPMPSPGENPCVQDNGGCQDLCLYLGETGKKRCICSHGKLKSDGLSCRPHEAFIMYSKLSQIDSLHMQDDESHNNSPYPPITLESKSHIISLTIDYNARRVIYSEMTQDQICSVLFNGTDRRILVEKQYMVEGIAFENNQLYWTSIQDNSISRLNISSSGALDKHCDSTGCKSATIEKLVKLGSEDKPRGIALDTCTSYVYWTNWNNDPSIQRAGPSTGYKIESIIKTNIRVPNGIAIDQKRRKLYWCDARLDKIETCDMDGSNRVILINAMPQHPFALAIWRNNIYWTDWLARGVFRADKYTGQQAMQIKKIAQRPMGIAVASPDTYSCPVNLCAKNNGGCPTGYTCVSRETENGQSQVSCKLGDHNHELRQPTIHAHNNMTCLNAENVTKCREYHAIIQDQLEPYRLKAISVGDQISADDHDQLSAQNKPSIRMVVTNMSDIAGTSPVSTRTSTPMPETTSRRSNMTSSENKKQPSGSTTTEKPTTSRLISGAETTTTPSSISAPATQNASSSQTSSSPPPCQVSSAPLQTTTSDSASNNDCRNPHDFKCYLSEKLICISHEKHCDGTHDCPNREDESDCYISSRGQYNFKYESNWQKFVTVILIILGAAVAALFLVFGNRGRRRWFVGYNNGFNHSKMFEENGTNIEISNPMFDEDDSVNLVNCPFSIDLNERTTNFSNPLYERQVLLVNDKNTPS